MSMSADADTERFDFALRLALALKEAGQPLRPSEMARAYNAICSSHSITCHTARKWLNAEVLPRQEKLQVLCDWLKVSPQWLRFGHGTRGA